MIKKALLTLSIAGLLGVSAKAQLSVPCGTDEAHRLQLLAHPEIAEHELALRQEMLERMSKMDISKFAKTTDDGSTEYHVPVVFHIVHDYGADYIAESEIIQCMKDLNAMYNKKNADTADVILPFKGFINNSKTRYIGNARIIWHLATRAPDGSPTNGITRRRSYLTRTASDLSKYDQWPPNNYMNIWVINTFGSGKPTNVLAYAQFPFSSDFTPYYDGVITKYSAVNYDNTISHEMGHCLNLFHIWGNTEVGTKCGDDDVEDTPPTKGHLTAGCGVLSTIYDTACLYTYNVPIAKLRLDSLKRADLSNIIISDTSTSLGITFKNRTASTLNSFSFYPTAAIGSTYKIGLTRNGVLIDSTTVISTVINLPEKVSYVFKVAPADTLTDFKLFFLQNPGALRDTVTPSLAAYSRGALGTIQIKESSKDNFYNFFYDWKITYGFYKIYSGAKGDSLVDFPDTVNAQNVMDYSQCAKMFTAGQVERMRACLTSTGKGSGDRGNLITPSNLIAAGVFDATGALLPYPNPAVKANAEYSVEKGKNGALFSAEPSYFLCSDAVSGVDNPYSFLFLNRTWQATPTSLSWTLSNGATVPTSTTTGSIMTKFSTPGWATVKLEATNANGTTSFETMPSIYVADPNSVDPIGYFQEFTDGAQNEKWPMFNYYNNRYKWEIANTGVYDGKSMRYRSYDDRSALLDLVYGDPAGDYDDFFSPAFDLSKLDVVNGNLNFMYSGAYATNNVDLMKDVFEIAYSTNCGGSWTTLKTMKNAELQTVGSIPTSVREFTPAWDEWKPMSIDLKSGATTIRNSRVFFRFRYKPSARPVLQYAFASGNNFYIDRINISNYPLSVNEMILGDKKVAVAPNPTNANAFVLFQKANNHVTVEVLDITGKLVYSVTEKVDQNNARIEIPASYLGAKGVYMVRIFGDDNLNQTEKLIVY